MPDKRRLVSEDLYKLVFVSDPQISPDGKKIAFVRSHIDEKTKEYRSHIWMVPTDGGEPRQYTSGPTTDTAPRWSPDGTKLAFLSDRGQGRQIYVVPTTGGEAYQVTKLRWGAGTPLWSPDGTKIAFQASIDPDVKPEDWEKPLDAKAKEAEEKKRREEPKVLKNLRIKADMAMGLIGNRQMHIFVVDAEGKGPARMLTSGDFGHTSPSWSPDGKYIAFSANRNPDHEWQGWFSDIWVMPADGGEMRKLTPSDGPAHGPVWTPDGKHIIYAGHRQEWKAAPSATIPKLWKISVEGGEPVCLTKTFDRGVGDHCAGDSKLGAGEAGPFISPDGKTVYFLASDMGRTSLWSVPAEGGDVQLVLGGDREIYGFTMDSSCTKVAFAVSEPTFPGEIGSYDLSTSTEKILTQANKSLLDEVYIVAPETVPFEALEGWKEIGWIMKPVGWKEGAKYPAFLEIHGGPHSMYGYSFFFEFQLLANKGYGVIYTNPRGGAGFGQAFQAAVNGDYGGKDYGDLMAWTDCAIQHTGWIDENRLAVGGGSYGGFMTNWIVGHTSRFAAAVTMRSISNWVSFHGVSDIGYTFVEREVQADFYNDVDRMWYHSPLKYVKNVTTPLLILHGENDMRCPIEQGEQFYIALKKLKKEVEMVRFPGSNHELSRSGKPVLRVARLNHIIRWCDEHIKKNPEDYAVSL